MFVNCSLLPGAHLQVYEQPSLLESQVFVYERAMLLNTNRRRKTTSRKMAEDSKELNHVTAV